jgi:hypothetical protein
LAIDLMGKKGRKIKQTMKYRVKQAKEREEAERMPVMDVKEQKKEQKKKAVELRLEKRRRYMERIGVEERELRQVEEVKRTSFEEYKEVREMQMMRNSAKYVLVFKIFEFGFLQQYSDFFVFRYFDTSELDKEKANLIKEIKNIEREIENQKERININSGKFQPF